MLCQKFISGYLSIIECSLTWPESSLPGRITWSSKLMSFSLCNQVVARQEVRTPAVRIPARLPRKTHLHHH
jgi:hypothetical protein